MAEGAIGAGLSIGEASVGTLVDLKLSIDGMCDQVKRLHERYEALEKRYQFAGPVQLQLRTSVVSPGSGNAAFGLGGPKVGRLWEIRRLLIGGALWSSTVAGTAEIYVTSAPASQALNSRNLADMVDQASGTTPPLPSKAFYSSGQLILRFPQELHIVLVSPTASTQYVASGAGYDMPDLPSIRTFGE